MDPTTCLERASGGKNKLSVRRKEVAYDTKFAPHSDHEESLKFPSSR